MTDPLTNNLCTRLGIRVPVFGLAHRIEVAAAISRAGGLGVYAAARDGPSELEHKLRGLRQLCPDHPVGVDLLLPTGLPEHNTRESVAAALPQSHRDFVQELFARYQVPQATRGNFFSQYVRSQALFEEQVEAAVASGVEVFAAGVGTPPGVLRRARDAGQHTIALVGSVRHAQKALDAGAEILVAQGYDAGGHTGPIGTFTLVPQVVAAAQGQPVIAAGGIGTGAQVAASLALGAQGAWLGTLWLGTREHELPPALAAKLINARSEDTVITRAHSGKPCRVVRSAFSDEWERRGAPEPLEMPFQQALTGELLAAVEEHAIEPLMYEAAGQSVAWLRDIEPVANVMERLLRETRMALRSLTRYTE
ncbi:NAD(P)H-dependent flavin oxidoreductase [Paraburkholderia susongensis]|uniref:NAD(P)H-dependent flavin oxidoreductase YrpB, nitropropane dioxygenase family n=1 Tax=Paraburkholderia susongensis TaxID=1515439 RepID=A0A1X7M194_9BURK|nr:nitronate monooxygenase family protein [Paraburkholderia susongensis]SMG59524.1 NAD(P)H-dependent flavin oxidoreductase YrpB, nitropropane dioxygenase family [Paraburkholderia susongensis]